LSDYFADFLVQSVMYMDVLYVDFAGAKTDQYSRTLLSSLVFRLVLKQNLVVITTNSVFNPFVR